MLDISGYFIKWNLKKKGTSILWAQWKYLEGTDDEAVTRLYQYDLKGETVLLENEYEITDMKYSEDKKKLLVLMDNWGDFRVAEYDMENRECRDILCGEQIEAFLDENGYTKLISDRNGYCVRYYGGDKISLLYGDYILGYSERDGLKVLYEFRYFPGMVYEWMENDTVLLINDGYELVRYDPITKKDELIMLQSSTFNFTLSADEKILVYEDTDKGYLWKYDMVSREKERLCKRHHFYPELRISEDNRYLICMDAVQVLSSYIRFIYVVDMESGKKAWLRKWGLNDPGLRAVEWNQ